MTSSTEDAKLKVDFTFDHCLLAMHTTFNDFGERLGVNTSKDVTSVPTVTGSKEETYEHSPSSDESSIGFGSPLLNFEYEANKGEGNKETPLLFEPVPALVPSFSSAMEKVAALPSIAQQASHTATTTTAITHTRSPRDPRLASKVEPIVKSVNTPYHPPPSSSSSSSYVVKKPYARPPTKSFSVPKIRFQGTIYNSLTKEIKMNVTEIVTEGLLVNEFLDDFEKAVRQIGLDIDENWYGLMEGSFKEMKERHLELYLWFKKRLFEGLPWSGAKTIIQRQIGFYSSEMTHEIKNALPSYIQRPDETFQRYYIRFSLYVVACKSLYLYLDHTLIHHFLTNQNTNMYNFLKECLKKQYQVKKDTKTLPLPLSVYNHLKSKHPQEHLVAIALAKVPSSWSEFGQTIISKLPLQHDDINHNNTTTLHNNNNNSPPKRIRSVTFT